MKAKERLRELQEALSCRGVKGVTFLFSLTKQVTLSKLTSDVADVLEAVQNGQVEEYKEKPLQFRSLRSSDDG